MYFKLKIAGYYIWLKYNKWKYRNSLSQLQSAGWLKLTDVVRKSPFYKEFLKENTSLRDFPIMNKLLFMKNFNLINTAGIKIEDANNLAIKAEQSRDFTPMLNDITVGLSSGTSGNRGIFMASENERAMWVASILDRVIGFSFKKRKVAFFLRANSNLYNSINSTLLSFEYFDLLDSMKHHIERLNRIKPDILVAQPSMLLELSKSVRNNDLKIFPKKIISIAEVLYSEDSVILEQAFKQKIHQVYQATEGFLASTCKLGTLHFNEDFIIVEKKYLDDNKDRFYPIITDLHRYTQPIIRYEMNDIIVEKKCCACGNKMLAIERIEGRSDDILIFLDQKLKEVKIYPDFFRKAIIISDQAITEYQVIQTGENSISLFIEGNENAYNNAEKSIDELLKRNGILNLEIIRLFNPRHQKENKLRRIQNDFRKTN